MSYLVNSANLTKVTFSTSITHNLKAKISGVKYGINLKSIIQKLQGFNSVGPIVIQLEKNKSTKKIIWKL
ncbi:hypothetical protein YYE_03979 [Plasmodium vinckei vinckei]|uniref:Uncharacterized protein n=2 Tax=Plasmodium vinckei vinckei TaxID=54757 RepID=A0A081I958_PLAVN|nr:hypothetical protein YYE_04943 [Plasmodium vinckei vinckei]KEG01389.1 hypothetical protein YYE_03979 [Plasmodium vinckei vinckei]